MATGNEPSKKAFVEAELDRNPEANDKKVNKAWKEAGNEGSISSTLFYKVKSSKGLTKGPLRGAAKKQAAARARRTDRTAKTTAPVASESQPRAAAPRPRRSSMDELEAEFDQLLFKVMGQDMPEVEEAIREARRRLIREQWS